MTRTAILHLVDELRVGGAQTHLVTMLREGIVPSHRGSVSAKG